MHFSTPLVHGTLIRRYKRFLADVVMDDGRVVIAHCANPGRMLGVMEEGCGVWLSAAPVGNRKLLWSWELSEMDGTLIGINTAWPNPLAEEAVVAGRIAELAGYDQLKREVGYGQNSRIDLLLGGNGRPICYVEVKNVHLRRAGAVAEFPDCVTLRGAKHLAELSDMVAKGCRAVMLYVVQRPDCTGFSLADDLDPGYARAFAKARAAGVEAYAYGCTVTLEGIAIDRPLVMLA